MKRWTNEDIEALRHFYETPGEPLGVIASRLGRSLQSIKVKAHKLGLHRRKEWKRRGTIAALGGWKEYKRLYDIEYRQVNKARKKAVNDKWREANAAYVKAWHAAWDANSRATKKQYIGTCSATDILFHLENQNGLCAHAWCCDNVRDDYHIDHIVPLSRGGVNERSNIQILCASCNLKKARFYPDEFERRREALLTTPDMES